MTHIEAQRLHDLADYVLLNAVALPSSGLAQGKAGGALALFEAATLLGDEALEDGAFNLLQEALLSQVAEPGWQSGWAGIGRVLLHVIRADMLEADFDELFGEKLPELLLVDLKLMDSEKHRYYCGVPNELILSNIRMVSEAGMRFFIRIPLIEGVNADEDNITRSADFLASLPKKPDVVNLLPYHDIGKNKHEKLGTIYNPKHIPMEAPSPEWQQRCVEIFRERGVKAEIGG